MDGKKDRLRPVNGFAMTELASKGLFPLGSQQNLHAGVHLELSNTSKTQKSREIRSLAPGHVVAVRMANALPAPELNEQAKEALGTNALSQEFAGNHNSFILLRHDVEEFLPKDEHQTQVPKRFTFYSLYMHLVPPDWTKAETYRDVSWLKALARRDGCLAVLDPQHDAFQQLRWLALPAKEMSRAALDVVPIVSGTFSTIGAELSKPQPLQLGDKEDDYIRAAFKKPERDLTELHEALVSGKIVTLCHPYLKVRAGELLGYLDEKSAEKGSGFLHWEILAPSEPGQLEQFLQFAEEKLGLSSNGKRFFEFFEEKDQQNNFFEPPAAQSGAEKKGELDELLKFAPVSERTSEEEKKPLLNFYNTYRLGQLQNLLRSPRLLPFYTPRPEDRPPEEPPDKPILRYPIEVLLENYKDCLPTGKSYTLLFTFEPSSCPPVELEYDGKQRSVRIHVPAEARKIFVQPKTPGSLFLQSGGAASREESLKEDVEHFKTLASNRWRNVVLRHLNDWIPENIVKQTQEVLKFHGRMQLGDEIAKASEQEKAQKIIQKYANAIGWWAHDEKPVLGPSGDEKPLFADNPDDEQLPKHTFLDNPHPITFAWLLMLLTRHNVIQFADTPLWQSEERKKLAAVGWLPARQKQASRRVGELVYVGALQRGEGKDKVTLHVTGPLPEPWRLEVVRGQFNEGVFAAPVEMPGWGEWSLDEPDAQALGELKLSGLEPVLLKAPTPAGENGSKPIVPDAALVSHKDETFSWRLAFRANCPRLLRGWILVRTWKGKLSDTLPKDASVFETAELAIPVCAREDTAFKEEAGFAVIDGFIKKGTVKNVNTYVTQHFTYKEFLNAARGQEGGASAEPLIAWDLVEAVERIRSGYAARQPVSLSKLAKDGLSVQLRASNPTKLRECVARAKDDGWLEDAEEAGKGEILIRVKKPQESPHPGELVVEFDADEVFDKLRKKFTHEDQLAVQFGCFFPNGGSAQDGRLLESDTIGKRCEAVKVEELRQQARGGYLELWSPAIAEMLHSPMFGEPEILLTPSGAQVIVPLLGGNKTFWSEAKPGINLGSLEADKKAKCSILSNPRRVVRSFSFSDKHLKGRMLVISAFVNKTDVPLKTERIDVQPSRRIQYDMKPGATLETRPAQHDPFLLSVTLSTTGVPASRGFKLEFATPSGTLLTLPRDCVTYELAQAKGAYGVTDSKGIFRAKVDVSDISAALQGGKEYELRAVPVNKADEDLALSEKLSLPEPLQEEAEEVPETPFLGMWPQGLDDLPEQNEEFP